MSQDKLVDCNVKILLEQTKDKENFVDIMTLSNPNIVSKDNKEIFRHFTYIITDKKWDSTWQSDLISDFYGLNSHDRRVQISLCPNQFASVISYEQEMMFKTQARILQMENAIKELTKNLKILTDENNLLKSYFEASMQFDEAEKKRVDLEYSLLSKINNK